MKLKQTSKCIPDRRGSLLTEGIVACLILSVAIGMLVPGLAAIGRQRKAMRFDLLAMIELNNIADIVRTSEADSADEKLSQWFLDRYADAEFAMEPLTNTDDDSGDLLQAWRLTLRRPYIQGMPDQKVSVVVWQPKGELSP